MTTNDRFYWEQSEYSTRRWPNIETADDIYEDLTIEDIATIWCDSERHPYVGSWDGNAFSLVSHEDGGSSHYRYSDEDTFVKKVNESIAEWKQDEQKDWWNIFEIIENAADSYSSVMGRG